jgi:isopentenyl phosphate kinase
LIIKIGYSFITKKPIQGEAKERSLYATARLIPSFYKERRTIEIVNIV